MERNQTIVDRIKDTFLKRLREEPATSPIATEVAELLTESEKPKADNLVSLYESHFSKTPASEGSVAE